MSEYAKNIMAIEDMWKKRIELREEVGERMSEYIITDRQLKTATEAYLEHELSRPITEVFISGDKLPEIVRCRDCAKWSFFDVEDGVRYGECAEFTAKVDSGCGHATRESGFCAWGERW